MKTFKQLRESLTLLESDGPVIWSKKINGVSAKIEKVGTKFKVYIDGDDLDTYNTQKEAESMAMQFIKQYKG